VNVLDRLDRMEQGRSPAVWPNEELDALYGRYGRALIDVARAAWKVDSWWVMESMRNGIPEDGSSRQGKEDATALHEALAPLLAEEGGER